ncbi:MAG: O-antigen ligase family protein [Candidatus Dormibacterales bacterium]
MTNDTAREVTYPLTIRCAAATAALAPAYVIRWHIGFYPTTLLEAAILVTLAVFAVESWRARAMPVWRGPLTIPTIVFLVAGAVSVVDAPSHTAALGIYRAYLVEPILFAVALVTALRTARDAYWIIAGLCIGATVLSAANIVVVLQAFAAHTFHAASVPPVAIYSVSNAVALYLVPLIAVTVCLAIHGTDSRLRPWLWAFLAVSITAAILTFSRGGWLALVAVGVGIALSHRRRWPILGGLAVVAIALALVPPIRGRLVAELAVYPGSGVGSRTVIWANSLKMLEHHAIFGAGLSGFAERMGAGAFPYGIPLIYPHNIVLNFWSETGLLGLFAFAAIFVIAARISWRGWRAGASEWRPIHLGVLLALVAILTHGIVDVPYFKNDLALEFWILVAFTLAAARQVVSSVTSR